MAENNENEGFMTEIYSLLNSKSNVASLGNLIEKRMLELELSQRQLAAILGLERPSLRRFIDGEAQKLDLLTSLKLVQFLGLEVDEFIKMFVSTLPKEHISELEKVRKANYLVETFDLKTLKKVGFIESSTDYDEIEKKIINQFSLDSIFDYSIEVAYPLFARTKRPFSDKMLEFWVKSAFAKFTEINNPNAFDKKGLEALIPRIRPYSRDVEGGLLTVAKALFNLGITIIVQPYLSKTQIKGMTMIVNGKPCIALSNIYNRYPTLWFTLLHELAHAYYDMPTITTMKYHISGADDLFLLEPRANKFASEILFSEEKVNYIKTFIDSPGVVEEYAAQNKVHSSIIYGIYIRNMEDNNPGNDYGYLYAKYSSFINISPEKAIKTVRTEAWGDCNIQQDVERVKKVFSNVVN